MKKGFLVLMGCLLMQLALSQPKTRKLGPALNSPSFNYTAPFISLDGNTILFNYDYTDDGQPAPFISTRQGVDWKEPIGIPKKITALGFVKATTMSPDGKTVFLTSSRGGTLGGFDIWVSSFNGASFTDPVSIGAPINSPANEGSPCLSPDGSTIFFMRCSKMTIASADECKIFMSKKGSNGLWATPVELPASINAGNSQMPRMAADGQTLIFSSSKHMPNKGGLDFYLAQWVDGVWTTPQNLDFANTAGDDVFASVNSLGTSLLRDAPGAKRSELVEYTFPESLRPKATTRVIGILNGTTDASKATVAIVDLPSGKTHAWVRPDSKGNFVCYVPQGGDYGLFVDPPMENMSYFFKRYDFRITKPQPIDRVTVNIKPVAPGDEIELTGVSFKPYSSELEPMAASVLQRVSKIIWGNSSVKFEINVTLYGLVKDSNQQPDLTEVITNSIKHQIVDTVYYEKEFQVDSGTTEMRDSIAIEVRDSISIQYTYHNDRTEKQAKAIQEALMKFAVKPERVTCTFKALEEPLADRRRTVIKLIAR